MITWVVYRPGGRVLLAGSFLFVGAGGRAFGNRISCLALRSGCGGELAFFGIGTA